MERRVQEIVNFMRAHLGQDLPLAKLAEAVKLSPGQLNYLFKSQTGITATQYLKKLRMKKAKELLAKSFLSVKEIAVEVGLNDASHFVRDFKRACGLTPTQYRNSLSTSRRRKSLSKKNRPSV